MRANAVVMLPGETAAAAWKRGQKAKADAAEAKTPPVTVELSVDPALLAWFQAQGDDYQTRMLAALRLYALAHRVK